MYIKNLWDKFTDKYSFLPIHPQYFLKKYNQTAIDFALTYSRGILLDIGCGRMPYRKVLLPKVKKYIGLDSPKTAKMYHGGEKPDIFADATNIPLPNNSCDTILLLQVIEHLPNPSQSIKEIARLLKPGGTLILSTVQSYPLHDGPFDFYRYTIYGLRYLLKAERLKILKVKEEGNIFIMIFQSFNVYLMLTLKKMLTKKSFIIVAFLLAPIFLTFAFILNLITLLFINFDQKSNFRIIHTIVAKKP